MAVTTNFQVPGISDKQQAKIRQALNDAFAERPGRWHVQFLGDRGDEIWEAKLSGPAVETSGYVTANELPAALAAVIFEMAG